MPEKLRHKLLDVVSARWDHHWTEDCMGDFRVWNERMPASTID